MSKFKNYYENHYNKLGESKGQYIDSPDAQCHFDLVQTDWHAELAHLLEKVKMKYQNKNAQNFWPIMSIIRELCDIRDGRQIACDIISKAEVCSWIDIICTEWQ